MVEIVGGAIGMSGIYHSLVIDPSNTSTLYGGLIGFNNVFDSGIFKSTNSGITWQRVLPDRSIAPALDGSFAQLIIDPVTPSTIYAGVLTDAVSTMPPHLKRGFYKSVDSGENWSLKTSLPDTGITALAIDPQNPSRLYAASAIMSASVSAASYSRGLARESLAAMFGSGFTNATEGATSIPLPSRWPASQSKLVTVAERNGTRLCSTPLLCR